MTHLSLCLVMNIIPTADDACQKLQPANGGVWRLTKRPVDEIHYQGSIHNNNKILFHSKNEIPFIKRLKTFGFFNESVIVQTNTR